MARLLGIDFGTRRIGLAVSDDRAKIASPLAVYTRRDAAKDYEYISTIIDEYNIGFIVLGLPLLSGGREGPGALLVRGFGAELGAATGKPIVYHDERSTSADAEAILDLAQVPEHKRRAMRDKIAAQVILQSFLDAGSPGLEIGA